MFKIKTLSSLIVLKGLHVWLQPDESQVKKWKTEWWKKSAKLLLLLWSILMLWLFHFTLNSLVSISPSEASSWCLSTYMLHLDRAFSLGVDTLTALGMIGCMTVSNSKLEVGLWSTHFSPPAECERLCMGWTGRAVWWPQGEEDKSESYSHSMTVGLIGKADHQNTTDWAENMYCWCVGVMEFMEKNEKVIKSQPALTQLWTEIFFFFLFQMFFSVSKICFWVWFMFEICSNFQTCWSLS